VDRLLSDLNISTLLLDYSGVEWEKTDTGWFDPDTQLVFTEAQVLQILCSTTCQLAGTQ
jgi:hypothetical protein